MSISNLSPEEFKALVQLVVESERELNRGLSSTTMIQLDKWLIGQPLQYPWSDFDMKQLKFTGFMTLMYRRIRDQHE